MENNDFTMLDNMAEIALIEDRVGNIKYANKAFCTCYGVNVDDVIGKSCFDFIIPDDWQTCNVEEVVTPENPYYKIEGRSKRADGKIIWIQYIGRAYFDQDGNRIEFQEIGVDITQWKEKIEESAKELAKANEWITEMGPGPSTKNQSSGMSNQSGKFAAMYKFSDIYTANEKMKVVVTYAEAVSIGAATILIEGESGTGKELFAQAIHNASKRINGPFIAINCGVIPAELIGSEFFGYVEGAFTGASKGGKPGKFEMASGGTLFLDEVGEMPLTQQVALLRVLETRTVSRIGDDKVIPVDVRIICATNKNLYDEVKAGRFRGDLYYRLNVINLRIPPLRERREDIFLLIGAFIKRYGRHRFDRKRAFTDKNLISFYDYDWPGNVRELQNMVERLMYIPKGDMDNFFDTVINEAKDGPSGQLTGKEEPAKPGKKDEKKIISGLLVEFEGNISMVARKLEISRNTLYKKIKQYKIKY
ncbi:MAG: sigma 54-interacting transcriptional regulator [Anaerovoracaceae bacterium]